MTNQSKIELNDPKDRARAILATCLEMRKRVDDFLQMEEGAQKEQDQEEIHIAFSHLANCQNQEAFITLAGNAQGAGLCNALWEKISNDYDDLSDLVCEHLTRIKYPDLWLKLEESLKKDEMGIKPNLLNRFINWVFEWMFSPPKKPRAKEGKKDGKD